MKLRFTPQAVVDIGSIADFLHSKNPVAALRVRDSILDSVQNLAAFPKIGRIQNVAGVRKLITRKYGYLVYYSVDQTAGEIAILSVQHPKREREYQDA